ncbi:hypothetical protein D3C77_243370 [compost metagenome]
MPFAQLPARLVEHPLTNADDVAVLLGQGNELVRRDHAQFRMLPAQQGFDADHTLVAVAYLRLIHQVQLVAWQGFAQVFFQFATAAHLAVDAGDIKLVAIARASLGQGHGLFGFLQQLLGAVAVFGEQGDADGGAQADFLVVEGEGRLQVIEDALGQFRRLVGLFDIGLHQCKLIATQARQGAEPATVGTQAIGQGQQQLVTGLIAELLVDALEVVKADTQYGHPALQAAGIDQDLVQLLLQLLAIGQAGEKVVLGHAQQAVLGLMAQMGVALDGGQQLIGRVDPQPQFVEFVALDQRDLVLAGAVGIDLGEVLDDLRQRLGQHPVIDQVQHQAHGQGAQHPGNEDDHRVDQKPFAVAGSVQGDAQVAVVFAIGAAAHQLRGKGAFLAQDQVGQPASRGFLQRTVFLRQHGFIGMADGGHAHRLILKQPFHDLHAHFLVQAVDGLGGGVAEHVEDSLGVVGHCLTSLVGIEDDLRTTENDTDHQCREQYDPEQLDR